MEEVLIDLYNRAQTKGYKKSLENFTSLLYTNDDVLQDMYGYVQSKGYSKSLNDFENLIGKKKNELDIQPLPQVDMALPSEDGSLESQENIKGEEQTFFDELLPNTEIADFMGDMLTNVRQGLAQGASIDDALKVMRQGSDATEEDIQNYIEAVSKMQSMPITDEMKDFSRIYESEDNKFLGFYKGLKENPSVIPGIIAQSVSNMANFSTLFGAAKGAVAGGATGSVVPVLGTAAGAVYGGIAGMTNTLEKGLAFTEFLQEEIQRKGLQFDEEGVRAVLNDPEAIKRVKRRTVGRGAAIATVNALTAGLAGKAGRAASKLTKLPVKGVARRGTEMFGGGLAEATGRAVAGQEQDVAEIGFEAIGEIGDPTSIFNLTELSRKPTGDVQSSVKISSYEVNGQPANKSDIEEILDSGDVETISQINYTITNDPELSNRIEQARADAIIARDIKETFDDDKQPSENQLKNLIDIQKKITKAKNNPTPRAKEQLENLQKQFKTISDAIQEPSTETIPVSEQPETSPTVREGDTQGAEIAGEITSEQIETTTQPAEKIETQVETQEGEVVEDITPATNKIGNFDVVIDDNKIVSITKDGKKPSSRSLSNVEKQIIETGLINVNPEEKIQTEGLSEVEFSNVVLEESNNPSQIAEEIEFVQSKIKEQKQEGKDRALNPFGVLFNIKFTPESYEAITGNKVSEQSPNFRRTWIASKEKGGESLEDGWQVIFEEANLPVPALEEVTDFIDNFQTKGEFNRSLEVFSPQLLNDLKTKFQELTGLNPTPTNIKRVADVTPEQIEERVSREIFEAERRAEDKPIVSPERRKTPKPKETLQKEASKKVKQTVPADPTEPASKPPLQDEVQEAVNKMIPAIDRITLNGIRFGLDNIASQVKVFATRRNNVLLQKARNTPTQYIDQSLGVNNSTVIADNTFTTLAEAQAQLYGNFNKVQDELNAAQKLIDFEGQGRARTQAGISRARNKSLMDTYELGLYMQVREADANKIGDEFNNEIAPNPVDMLDITINNERPAEAKALKELKNKYVKNGKINKDEIKNNFSAAQNKALKTLDKKNKELLPKMQEIAKRRNFTFTPIKEYIHRAVLLSETSDRVDVLKNAERYSNQSTRAKSSFERKEGVKPIDYNPFNATLLGTQETFLDFYVTPEADKVQTITEELIDIYKKGNEGQQKAVSALDESVKEILKLTYLRSFMGARNVNAGSKIQNEINKNAYRAMLSSGTRAFSEYLGNTLMLISQDPQVIKDTYTKYKKLGKDPVLYRDILLNLGSAEIRKLTDKKTLSNKNIDVNDYLNLGQSRESMIANPVFQKMDQIMKYGPKQLYKGVAKVADELMSMGDTMVAKPLWPAKFAFEFKKNVKKQLGEDINITDTEFEKIAKGTSKFVTDNKYKKARLEAVRKSDRTITQFITSGNPMYRIIKNIQTKSGEGVDSLMDYYRMLNSYMANFNLNEYASARFAIGALFKSGYLSKREAIALQAGILARMSSYVAMYNLFSQFMDELLGAPEEENEDDLTNTLKRQLLGSAATLVFRGGIGNMWSLPINAGIEKLNKEYLENLRNGAPYDAYDNSIVYSLISLDDFGEKKFTEILLPILAGRYGPYAKSLFRSLDLTGRIYSAKTLEAREKATEELLNRMVAFEFLGLLGFIPLYKDWRRLNLKKRFNEENQPGGSVRR